MQGRITVKPTCVSVIAHGGQLAKRIISTARKKYK